LAGAPPIAAVSVAGAAAHNLGQLVMAALILQFAGIIYYLPFMLLFSVPTGIITGLLVKTLVNIPGPWIALKY
jgi:heptaprenyl diphosphate synthase